MTLRTQAGLQGESTRGEGAPSHPGPWAAGPPVRLCFAGVGLAYPGTGCLSLHEVAVCREGHFILIPTQAGPWCPLDTACWDTSPRQEVPSHQPTICLPCLLPTPPQSNGKHLSIKFPKLPKALKTQSFSNNLLGSNTRLHQMGSCLQPSFPTRGEQAPALMRKCSCVIAGCDPDRTGLYAILGYA